jgi:hypothetical protein
MKKMEVTLKEAEKILAAIDVDGIKIYTENFRKELEVKLEHGICYSEANILQTLQTIIRFLTRRISPSFIFIKLHSSFNYWFKTI